MYCGQCEIGYISEERFDLAWLTCHTKINETNFILAFYCCSIWDTDLPSRRLYPMHVKLCRRLPQVCLGRILSRILSAELVNHALIPKLGSPEMYWPIRTLFSFRLCLEMPIRFRQRLCPAIILSFLFPFPNPPSF